MKNRPRIRALYAHERAQHAAKSASESALQDKKETQPKLNEEWQKNLVTRLSLLQLHDETSDVDIIVGEHKIPTHKTVLWINSDLLTAGEISYNSKCQKMEIELLPEFSGMFEIVQTIIQSFYTGKISVSHENAKGIYKFGSCYSVSWLTEQTFPILEGMINAQTYAELFDLAQNLSCKSLTRACLQKFDENLAAAMISTPEWLEQDYYRVKLISLSTDVQIPEIKMFEMLCKWLDHKPLERNSVAFSLLSNIHFDLIDHTNLINQVFTWINGSNSIDDEVRLSLFKIVSSASQKNKLGYPAGFSRSKLSTQESASSTSSTLSTASSSSETLFGSVTANSDSHSTGLFGGVNANSDSHSTGLFGGVNPNCQSNSGLFGSTTSGYSFGRTS